MKYKKYRTFCADYETTVYDGQESTEVWAAAIVELYQREVEVFNSIDGLFDYVFKQREDCRIYFHNIKFDGSFILHYLLSHGYKCGFEYKKENKDHIIYDCNFKRSTKLNRGEMSYMISSKGVWYQISFRTYSGQLIEIIDSLKLIPMSVKDMGEAFKTEHQKSKIEYKGIRKAGGFISKKEIEYIKNDVLVAVESLEYMFSQGHTKMTIGSCCYSEYKKIIGKLDFDELFPRQDTKSITSDVYNGNFHDYVNSSYKGAWTYVNQKYKGLWLGNGYTLDVTSLYPSVMHSISNEIYPVGNGKYVKGNLLEDQILKKAIEKNNVYYFIRFKCSFQLKDGYFPWIQIKNSFLYNAREHLVTSDIYDKSNDKYYKYDKNGNPITIELTMTKDDWEYFNESYDIDNLEILDGVYYYARKGLFDEYIDKYIKIKNESEGGMRMIAKLFLNNLYGKFATGTNSSFKLAHLENGVLKFRTIEQNNKTPTYIPVGSAITSKARLFTIKHAVKNREHFCYADTDSLHILGSVNDNIGCNIAKNKLYTWKLEAEWKEAIFVRPKTYIEHVGDEYEITCAGMGKRCKELVRKRLHEDIDLGDLSWDEYLFIREGKMELCDFRPGFKSKIGKLSFKQIKGGAVLKEVEFQIR